MGMTVHIAHTDLNANKTVRRAGCADPERKSKQENRPQQQRELPLNPQLQQHWQPSQGATTVVLKSLPLNYRRNMLLKMLDYEGFAGEYDFVYLPVDFDTGAGLGYAFINVVTPDVVARFWKTFEGYKKWMFHSTKVCSVGWSTPHQGLAAHIERFRNSPLMHDSVKDEYRPILLEAGSRVAFPPPTRDLWAPNFSKASKTSRSTQRIGN